MDKTVAGESKHSYDTEVEEHEHKGKSEEMSTVKPNAKVFDELEFKTKQNMIGELPEFSRIRMGDVDDIHEIGSGEFGIAYKAFWNSVEIVIKVPKTQEDKSYMNELQALMATPISPNVLSLVALCEEFKFKPMGFSITAYVVPFQSNGDLKQFLMQHGDRNMRDYVNIVLGMARGIQHLHKHNRAHRDIHLENFLVSSDGRILVSDFGSSRYLRLSKKGEKVYQIRRDNAKLLWRWCSPETLKDALSTTESDIWMFGVTIWEMFNDGDPFADFENPLELKAYLSKNEPTLNCQNVPPIFQKLISECLITDRGKRFKIGEIVDFLRSCGFQKASLSGGDVQDSIGSSTTSSVHGSDKGISFTIGGHQGSGYSSTAPGRDATTKKLVAQHAQKSEYANFKKIHGDMDEKSWACIGCTVENRVKNARCAACGSERITQATHESLTYPQESPVETHVEQHVEPHVIPPVTSSAEPAETSPVVSPVASPVGSPFASPAVSPVASPVASPPVSPMDSICGEYQDYLQMTDVPDTCLCGCDDFQKHWFRSMPFCQNCFHLHPVGGADEHKSRSQSLDTNKSPLNVDASRAGKETNGPKLWELLNRLAPNWNRKKVDFQTEEKSWDVDKLKQCIEEECLIAWEILTRLNSDIKKADFVQDDEWDVEKVVTVITQTDTLTVETIDFHWRRFTFLFASTFIIILGVLNNFWYDWSSQSDSVVWFAATDNSTFEHIKMLVWPWIFCWIFVVFLATRYSTVHNLDVLVGNYILCAFCGLWFAIAAETALTYLLRELNVTNNLVADIVVFVISILFGVSVWVFLAKYRIHKQLDGILGCSLIFSAIGWFTVCSYKGCADIYADGEFHPSF